MNHKREDNLIWESYSEEQMEDVNQEAIGFGRLGDPSSRIGQGLRKFGKGVASAVGARNVAAKMGGKIEAGDEANKLYRKFNKEIMAFNNNPSGKTIKDWFRKVGISPEKEPILAGLPNTDEGYLQTFKLQKGLPELFNQITQNAASMSAGGQPVHGKLPSAPEAEEDLGGYTSRYGTPGGAEAPTPPAGGPEPAPTPPAGGPEPAPTPPAGGPVPQEGEPPVEDGVDSPHPPASVKEGDYVAYIRKRDGLPNVAQVVSFDAEKKSVHIQPAMKTVIGTNQSHRTVKPLADISILTKEQYDIWKSGTILSSSSNFMRRNFTVNESNTKGYVDYLDTLGSTSVAGDTSTDNRVDK